MQYNSCLFDNFSQIQVLAITKLPIAISGKEHSRWTSPICAVMNVPFNPSSVVQYNNGLGKTLLFGVITQAVADALVTAWIYCNLADRWESFTKIFGSELTIHFT